MASGKTWPLIFKRQPVYLADVIANCNQCCSSRSNVDLSKMSILSSTVVVIRSKQLLPILKSKMRKATVVVAHKVMMMTFRVVRYLKMRYLLIGSRVATC